VEEHRKTRLGCPVAFGGYVQQTEFSVPEPAAPIRLVAFHNGYCLNEVLYLFEKRVQDADSER
jgi:hypothetical protein